MMACTAPSCFLTVAAENLRFVRMLLAPLSQLQQSRVQQRSLARLGHLSQHVAELAGVSALMSAIERLPCRSMNISTARVYSWTPSSGPGTLLLPAFQCFAQSASSVSHRNFRAGVCEMRRLNRFAAISPL